MEDLPEIPDTLEELSKIMKENETNKETQKEDKQTPETTRQTQKQPQQKKRRWTQNIIFLGIFTLTAAFMLWTNKAGTPENSTLMMIITLSVLTNISIILVMIGTGIGIELTKRFLNKFRYKSGNYVNSLHVMKSGVIKERFVKKDAETGTFRMVDKPYVTNPKLMFNYKSIPTYFHRDGHPDPLDIWQEDLTGDLSNSEMDIAMNSKGAFDVKEWLDKNKQLIFFGGLAVIGICIISAFFGYQTFEMLRDGTFQQITEVTCKNIPKVVETIQQTNIGG